MEVALFYLDFIPQPVVVISLMLLMILKFAIVALWFMHLRFDSRIFRRLFITGIILAISVFVIVLLTFGVFFRE
jgi:cytochrome c oxidase subunit 4